MPQREEEADRYRSLALLHEFSCHVVNGGDVVSIDGVTKPKGVGKKGRTEKDWMTAEGEKRPSPDEEIGADQQYVEPDNPALQSNAATIDLVVGHELRDHAYIPSNSSVILITEVRS